MSGRNPVITGTGIVAAPGSGVDAIWKAVADGADGLRPLSLFASPRYGQVLAGEIRTDLSALGAPLRGSRSDRLGWLAARDAIASAKLDLNAYGDRAGVVLGSSVGGSYDSERFLTALIKQGRMRARPARFHECMSVVDLIAESFGLFGPGFAVATACSSGALAIATAAEFIQAGEADIMLAGGADSLSRMTWGGFHSLLLVDGAGCRPFDARRAGMSLGEGAAVLVLEAESSAVARGAKILARLTGWGASCDAHHATAPHPQGAGAAAAMRAALDRAGLGAADIQYVNAHGTGTRDNDLAEGAALKAIFHGLTSMPPVSSTKRCFGHALAASGAIEAVVCIEALRRQQIPPNPGFSTFDPAIGLEPVVASRAAALTNVMSNSFGFGGNNAVLIFSRTDSRPNTRAAESKPAAIAGVGIVGPGTIGIREIQPPLPPGQITAHDCGLVTGAAKLTPNQRRRLSRLLQMSLAAAHDCAAPISATRTAVAIGTGWGCLEDAGAFIENLIAKDEREPMPARFPNSVHNAAAAQIAIGLGARGLNSAPTAGDISFEAALWQCVRQLSTGEADCALAGAVDELNKYPLAIGKRWRLWNDRVRPGEGAVVANLTRPDGTGASLAHITLVRLGRWRRPFNAAHEADWITDHVELAAIDAIFTGAGGWPQLDPFYGSVVAELTKRAARSLQHQTYKQLCGEYPTASAFGFCQAIKQARQTGRGVLLYTLSPRGAKSICRLEP
jgi:3-oxoacyl-(acyl-carrier-protein) synthase